MTAYRLTGARRSKPWPSWVNSLPPIIEFWKIGLP